MGSKCCAGNDAVPDPQSRNTDDMKEQLMSASDSETENTMEGVQIDLETSTVIAYILSEITTLDLGYLWESVDPVETGQISIEQDLKNLFLVLIHNYIQFKSGRSSQLPFSPTLKFGASPYNEPADDLASVLAQHFRTILSNYSYDQGDVMTKSFLMENFQKYLAEPNPKSDDVIQPGLPMSDALSEEKAFDMLSFISTSSTIRPDGDFLVDHTVSILREAIESKNKDRGDKVGQILASLTEAQRIEVSDNYEGCNSQSLQSALKETFSGDLLAILTALCRSNAYNDAEWIEASKNKLNTNWSVINEILMSRTNSQLDEIKQAYLTCCNRQLLRSLLASFNDNGAYGSLLKKVLTEDAKILRKEVHPSAVKLKKVRDDAKILHHILEGTKGKVNKLKVIEMLCHRSWAHIALLCKEYGKKSNYDLKTMIEKKFGKNSKSGDALQKMIDISRNRHSFFAQLLFQSMKGIKNNTMLIRNIVGRSEIDLGEISAAFSQKYGNGKTLLQFIRSNRKGTYRNVLLRICAIGDDALDEEETDSEHTDVYSNDDDIKVVESEDHTLSIRSDVDHTLSLRSELSNSQHMSFSPTIKPFPDFEAHVTAKKLIAVMTDKKKEETAKKLLVKTLTMIDNKQRQELKKAFADLHPNGTSLADATQNTLRKGKTMLVMLGLLQRPCEFQYFWIQQAIKSKKLPLLIEILCSCSNQELRKLQDVYKSFQDMNKKDQNVKLQDHVDLVLGKKPTGKMPAKSLIAKILECKRPETTKPDKKLCKLHLNDLRKLLKAKNQKQLKQFFGKLFVENSYAQINYEVNKFNAASEHTLRSVVKKVMGSGQSGVIIDHIMKISTDRFGFYAEKMRESMKGIKSSEQVLIRILVSRSEKDLGNIVEHFAEENYGEGKTLRQWIENAFKKGSFQTSLLRIADVSDGLNNDDDSDHYDSMTDTEQDTLSIVPLAKVPLAKAASAVVVSRSKSESSLEQKSPRIVVSSPETVMDEINIAKGATESDDSKKKQEEKVSESSETVKEEYDPYDVDEKQFGRFIIEKVNEKTANRLMQHLKTGKNKVGDDEVIKPSQIIIVLLYACVLYLKYIEKTQKKEEVKVDKKRLKQSLMPAFNWMLENRFGSEYNVSNGLNTGEYKQLGTWLIEYYETKQEK
eukprot:94375_1